MHAIVRNMIQIWALKWLYTCIHILLGYHIMMVSVWNLKILKTQGITLANQVWSSPNYGLWPVNQHRITSQSRKNLIILCSHQSAFLCWSSYIYPWCHHNTAVPGLYNASQLPLFHEKGSSFHIIDCNPEASLNPLMPGAPTSVLQPHALIQAKKEADQFYLASVVSALVIGTVGPVLLPGPKYLPNNNWFHALSTAISSLILFLLQDHCTCLTLQMFNT